LRRNEETFNQVERDVAVDDESLEFRKKRIGKSVDSAEQVSVVESYGETFERAAPFPDFFNEIGIDSDLFRVFENESGQIREAGFVMLFVSVVPRIVLELQSLK
jgi:hypothetical protein